MERQQFSLYNGEVTLTFDPIKHKYMAIDHVKEITVNPVSVTTVLGVIDKPMLKQWAVNCALEHLKNRLLVGEHTPEDVDQYFAEAKYAHRRKTSDACTIGTQAHDWLENYWNMRQMGADHEDLVNDLPRPELEAAKLCVDAGLKWIAENKIEPIFIEKPLYSRELQVAGKMDKFAIVNGKKAVVDWKSSVGLYPEYIMQTAAYAKILEEETGDKAEERWLIKLGKFDGEFLAHRYDAESITADFEAFKGALVVYRRLQYLRAHEGK